jgi:hypothetical protein
LQIDSFKVCAFGFLIIIVDATSNGVGNANASNGSALGNGVANAASNGGAAQANGIGSANAVNGNAVANGIANAVSSAPVSGPVMGLVPAGC